MKIQRKWLVPLVLVLTGFIAALCCLLLLFAFIGDRTLLSYLAPYATFAEPTLSNAVWFFFLAAIQYPLYGIISAVAWLKGDKYKVMFIVSLLLLVTAHFVMAAKASRIAHDLILY